MEDAVAGSSISFFRSVFCFFIVFCAFVDSTVKERQEALGGEKWGLGNDSGWSGTWVPVGGQFIYGTVC